MKVLRLAGVVLAMVGGLITSASPEAKSLAEKPREIVFASDRLDEEIFVVNPDGSGARELSHDPGYATGPVPSPDGTRIAFTSSRHGNTEVYVMSRDGSEQRRLTQDTGTDVVHDWSPDGSELAVVSDRSGTSQIYALRADGSTLRQLTAGTESNGGPAWSPDGTRIAFVRSGELWLMRGDGTGERRLTSDPQSAAADPAWAPDSSRLVFVRVRPGFPFNAVTVNTMAADGTDVKTIATCPFGGEPAWSPDGRRIAVRIGASIFLMNPDGTDRRRFTPYRNTPDAPGDAWPRWFLDGQRVVFTRALFGDLYLASVRGGEARRLTSDLGPYDSAWSPNGRTIAFVRALNRLRSDIYLLTVDSEEPPRRLVRGAAPTWSPDGKQIAFFRRGSLYVMRAAGGRIRKLVKNGESPAWSPDGRRILFVQRGRWPVSRLWTIRVDGRRARRLPILRGEAPDWSPNGRRIVFGDGQQLRVANADGSHSRPLSRSRATRTLYATPSWSPDGLWIAYEGTGGSIWVVNIDGRQARRVVRSRLGDRNWAPDWRPISR